MEQFTTPYKIMRWNDWATHNKFQLFYKKIIDLYETDPEYKKSIELSSNLFLERMIAQGKRFDIKRGLHLCTKYLQEECAVMCLWAEEGFEFEVYPTGRNPCMAMTHEKLIKPQNPKLLRSVSIRFKKYGPKQQLNKNTYLHAA